MRRVIATVLLMLAFGMPVQGQSQVESIDVPFLILIDDEFAKPYEGGCRFNTESAGYATLEAAPTPYGPVSDATPNRGRFVTAEQSPLPGVEGCLFEIGLTLDFADKYDFQLIVHAGSAPNWVLDLGEMTFGEIIDHAPDPIIYHLDQEAFDTGIVEPEPPTESAATPQPEADTSSIALMVIITDADLMQQVGAGCVGAGEAEWMNGNTSILIAPSGATEGIQSKPIGSGTMFGGDMCTWSVPKTPPMEDNGAYQVIIDDFEVECSTSDMGEIDDGYMLALSVEEDGLHCASIS